MLAFFQSHLQDQGHERSMALPKPTRKARLAPNLKPHERSETVPQQVSPQLPLDWVIPQTGRPRRPGSAVRAWFTVRRARGAGVQARRQQAGGAGQVQGRLQQAGGDEGGAGQVQVRRRQA